MGAQVVGGAAIQVVEGEAVIEDAEVHIGQGTLVQLGQQVIEHGAIPRIAFEVHIGTGGETQAHPLAADAGVDGIHHLQGEAAHVLRAAAVLVGAQVAGVVQELVDEVAVGTVDLHPVKARLDGVGGGLGVILDQLGNVALAQGAGHLIHQFAHARHCAFMGDRRRCQHLALMEEGVGETTHVPQLGEDLAPLGVHGLGDLFPACDLLRAVDAGGVGIALAVRANDGGFGDDEADVGAAAIVGSHLRGRHQSRARHAAGEGGHHEAIREGEGAVEAVRLKQGIHAERPRG